MSAEWMHSLGYGYLGEDGVHVWCARCGEPVENIQTHCAEMHEWPPVTRPTNRLPVGRVIG